ncbi:MAG TPA: hypothetical protein VM580_07830 [Labilithrix sp.]|nr:hypothetical protein [Labilithrix sp.]
MSALGRRGARRSLDGLLLTVVTGIMLVSRHARADEPAKTADPNAPTAAQVDLTKDTKPKGPEDVDAAPSEAPPPPPYKKTLVLDSSVGAIGFLGAFGNVAPPGPWAHIQLGYEVAKWFMVYGEGELAFTDTSNRQRPPNTRAFAMYGFGGGVRFTIRFVERFGMYAQGGLGMLAADVPTGSLALLGFRDAESLGLYFGARLGLEWYQIDRHLALGLNAGIRTAQGFARLGAGTDTPLALDGGLSLRYAF